MSLIDVLVGAVAGGCIGVAGGVVAVKYEWSKQIDLVCMKEVYEPLHSKIIDYLYFVKKFVLYAPLMDVETFVSKIEDSYWYSRVNKKVAEKFREWQSRVSEYNVIVKDMRVKIEKAIDHEIETRATAFESSTDKNHLVSEFKRITTDGFLSSGATGSYLLTQGKANDEEYYFISNFKNGGTPSEREIRAKLANGFPMAIYEKIRKDPLFTELHNKIKEVEDTTSQLRGVLEKRIMK